jgi:hypothetical protein
MALPAARMAASRQLRRSVVPISRRAKIAASAACASLNSSARGGRAEAVLRPHIEVQLKAQAKARVRCLRRATARALEQTSLCPRSLLQPMGAMAPPPSSPSSPPPARARRVPRCLSCRTWALLDAGLQDLQGLGRQGLHAALQGWAEGRRQGGGATRAGSAGAASPGGARQQPACLPAGSPPCPPSAVQQPSSAGGQPRSTAVCRRANPQPTNFASSCTRCARDNPRPISSHCSPRLSANDRNAVACRRAEGFRVSFSAPGLGP